MLLLCVAGLGPPTRAQEPAPARPQEKVEEVVRVETEIVQTNVAVFDKTGKFVEGLTPGQFEVKVDGQVVPVAFFEFATGGRVRRAAVAEGGPAAPEGTPATARPGGRTVIFFIDDLHLSLDSLGRTRAALTRFLDEEMTPRDTVAFVTASGQLGFLQQFTHNRVPLRAAVGRLRHVPYIVRDVDQPPMTEYVAIRIQNGDREAASFYVDKILEGYATKHNPQNVNRNAVYEMVKNRANQLVLALETVTDSSLTALEKFLQTTQHAGGRKLIFFISDGFYLDSKNSSSGTSQNLRRVTELAARTESVLYTIDARGLFSIHPDATNERPVDPTGRLDRASVGESSASQDGLHTLAADTGGRFLKNQNYFDHWVSQNLEETSNYYVLAWRPEAEGQKGKKFRRVEVSVIGHPELTVRASRGYVTDPRAKAKSDARAAQETAENDLREALTASVAWKSLPTAVSASFVDVPGKGPVLTGSVQVATAGLDYGPDGKQQAALDVVGIVFNDQGKQAANFKARLNVTPLAPAASGASEPRVIYNHRAPLAPGLYQIRVAARDGRGGMVGSASEWIEIPDLSKKQLTLSSLHLGGRAVGGGAAQTDKGAPQVQFSVDRIFPRSSRVDFIIFVYNAARAGGGAVDLAAQVKIYSGGRAVVSSPANKLPAGEDPARVPFTGVLSLGQLPAGLYEIEVTVTDHVAKATAAQRVFFEIE